MKKMNKQKLYGIRAMRDEGYRLPIESEKLRQKTEYAWWSSPAFIVFLTISMSILDALVLYDVLDRAMTQSENLGKITSYGIALVLNLIPILIAKFVHQALYKIKRGAAVWAIVATMAFVMLFAGTVKLRFAYQDVYGKDEMEHIENQVEVEEVEMEDTENNPQKGLAVVLLFSLEPLVTSIVNFCLAFLSDDELREKINYLRRRRCELVEAESDLKAFIATMEPAELRRKQMLLLDAERKRAGEDEIRARCRLLKAQARVYLAEYLKDPEGASYVTSSLDERENVSRGHVDFEEFEKMFPKEEFSKNRVAWRQL